MGVNPLKTDGLDVLGDEPYDLLETNIRVIQWTPEILRFQFSAIDPAIANTIRRICHEEITTVAIDKVVLTENSGILPDEVLVHRLGLVPICCDIDALIDVDYTADEVEFEGYSFKFSLSASCSQKQESLSVYSGDLIFQPRDDRERSMSIQPRPVHSDILLTKLGPGQNIDLICYAVRGIGKTHVKWSPVATAWYRFTPHVSIEKEVRGERAAEIASSCIMGVFDIEDSMNRTLPVEQYGQVTDDHKLKVRDPSTCTSCRRCITFPEITAGKVQGSVDFTIETVGSMESEQIYFQALKVLRRKCRRIAKVLSNDED